MRLFPSLRFVYTLIYPLFLSHSHLNTPSHPIVHLSLIIIAVPRHHYSCSNNYRTTSEEKRHLERITNEDPDLTYQNIRRASEVHRQVRHYARKHIKPGMTMTEIANTIEDGTRALVEENGLETGVGFPTGLSLNNCAAHYTPNPGDTLGALFPFFTSVRCVSCGAV